MSKVIRGTPCVLELGKLWCQWCNQETFHYVFRNEFYENSKQEQGMDVLWLCKKCIGKRNKARDFGKNWHHAFWRKEKWNAWYDYAHYMTVKRISEEEEEHIDDLFTFMSQLSINLRG